MSEEQTESNPPSAAGDNTDGRHPSSVKAFNALVNLAHRSHGAAKGLPAQVDIKPHWSGIGFEILGRRFVAPMGEVSEMLEVPGFTKLPGVKSWIKGVANVRGRLLPVCDLAAFLGDQLRSPRKQQRILVLESGDLYTGLLVDQVFGMQHFPEDCFSSILSYENTVTAAFGSGCYNYNGVEWTVFSPVSLTADNQFMNAAQH